MVIGPNPLVVSSTAMAYSKSGLRQILCRSLVSRRVQQESATPFSQKGDCKPYLEGLSASISVLMFKGGTERNFQLSEDEDAV